MRTLTKTEAALYAAKRARDARKREAIARHASNNAKAANAAIKLTNHEGDNIEPQQVRKERDWLYLVVSDGVEQRAQIPTIGSIIDKVCEHFGLSREAIIGDRRTAKLTMARHIAMYMSHKERVDFSYQSIARIFRKKDHTTVLNACRKVGFLIGDSDALSQESIEKLEIGYKCGKKR